MKRKFILLPITLTALTPIAWFASCANNENESCEFYINGQKDMIPTIPCPEPDPKIVEYNAKDIMQIYGQEIEQNPIIFAQDAAYVVGWYANFAKTEYPNNVNELSIDLKYSDIKIEDISDEYAYLTFVIEGRADVDVVGSGTAEMLNDAIVHLTHFKFEVQHYPYICKSHHTSVYEFQSHWAVEPVFSEPTHTWNVQLLLDGSIQYDDSSTHTYDNQTFQYNNLNWPTDEWETLVFTSTFQYTSHLKSCYHMKKFPSNKDDRHIV